MKRSIVMVMVLVSAMLSIGRATAGLDVSGISISARYALDPAGYRYYLTVHNGSYAGYNLHVWHFDVHLLPALN